jgi:hypothetical protein
MTVRYEWPARMMSDEMSARKRSKKFQIPSLCSFSSRYMRVHSLHDKYAIGIVLDDAVYRGGAHTLNSTGRILKQER